MPIVGSDPRARMYAHVRCAGRYAKEKRLDKALAHFGRALEYGAGTAEAEEQDYSCHIYARIYVNASDKEDTPLELQGFLSRINNSDKKDAEPLVKRKASEYALMFFQNGHTRLTPTLKLEFYDATEKYERGAYVDVCKSDGSAIDESTEACKSLVTGIKDIVPTILKQVYSDKPEDTERVIRGIEVTKEYKYTIHVNCLVTAFSDFDDHIWKTNVTGKLRRRLVDEAGVYAHVGPLKQVKDRKHMKRARDEAAGHIAMTPPKRIVVVLSRTRDTSDPIDRKECESIAKKESANNGNSVILNELQFRFS